MIRMLHGAGGGGKVNLAVPGARVCPAPGCKGGSGKRGGSVYLNPGCAWGPGIPVAWVYISENRVKGHRGPGPRETSKAELVRHRRRLAPPLTSQPNLRTAAEAAPLGSTPDLTTVSSDWGLRGRFVAIFAQASLLNASLVGWLDTPSELRIACMNCGTRTTWCR